MDVVITQFNRCLSSGSRFASEDLCLSEDVELQNGTILRKGVKYFTYPQIKELLDIWHKTNKIPETYDLPTDKEFRQAVAEFGTKDGVEHSFNLVSSIGLGFYGSIGTLVSLEYYDRFPERFKAKQAIGYSISGNYWCEGTGKSAGLAQILWIHSSGPICFTKYTAYNGSRVGYSVRLIQRNPLNRS